MHKILLILLILQVSLIFGSQFEIVSEIKEVEMHLGLVQLADIDTLDNRGEMGALVIVNCGLEEVFFQNTASKISQNNRDGAYWVVMKQRAQYFVLSKDGFANYKYNFPTPLTSGKVYTMTIDELNKQADEVTLVITSNQDNASVYAKGELIGKTENKLLTLDLPLGNNEIELRKSGYKSQAITHNLSPENNKVEINLEPALPIAVTITTEPEGATVYIDNVLFGTSPKSSYFDSGTYPIRIKKESYATINEEIIVKEPETKKHYKLKDFRATLTINTSDLATIKLNGTEYTSVKNLKLPASVVEIEVSHPKAEAIQQVITLKQEEIRSLDIYPEIEKGTINVVTIPTTASIELTGDVGEYYTATGRKSFTDIPIGTYELKVTNEGYKTHKEAIKLTTGDMVQKQISLEEVSDTPEGFVFVEGGTFLMGSNDGSDDEKPVHSVTVSDFYIGKYEVTQAEWQEVMGSNLSNFKEDDNPVEHVSWYEAVDFCNKKSLKDGLEPVYSGSGSSTKCDFSKNGYRLPTEAEWEYAARGGNKSQGYTYSGSNIIDEVAEYECNNNKSSKAVGGKKPNELGIYDLSGNIHEWCWDWHGDYSSSSQSNPVGPTSGTYRVFRGGFWSNREYICRVANRCSSSPTYDNNAVGFRLARSSE